MTEITTAGLKILSLDVTTLPGSRPSEPQTATPSWRTSFGSERRTPQRATGPESPVEADIVLLQGIRDMRSLRLWFPARTWKLVVSRQLLLRDDPLDRDARDGIAAIPTTAVAVRYQPGMRITAQDHLMDLVRPAGTPAGSPAAAAGVAVRVQLGARDLWALSVLLPPACASAGFCPGHAPIAVWRDARAAEGALAVIGGRFAPGTPQIPGTARPGPPEGDATLTADMPAHRSTGCASYSLLAIDPPSTRQTAEGHADPALGCIATIVIGN